MDTHNFQTVAEVTESALLNILREAWRSGGLNLNGTLPQEIQLPAGMALGPFTLADGTVQFPQDQIRIDLNPDINGVNLTIGIIADLEIQNPPVPSATIFNITADVTLRVPIGQAPDPGAPLNLAILLENLPTNAVDVVITSGDPFANVLANGPAEFIHKLYQIGTIPHLVQDIPLVFPPFGMKASVEFFDDESDPARQITVGFLPGQMQINLPCSIRFYDITGGIGPIKLASPMGMTATVQLTVPFSNAGGHIHIGLDAATSNLINIQPALGIEGTNYTINKTSVDTILGAGSFENAIRTGFITAANVFFAALPPVDFDIPTLADLETQVENFIRTEMNSRRYVILWAPTDAVGGVVITNITPKVLNDTLAIALNAGSGANANALVNFIPAPCDFAIGLDDDFVEAKLNGEIAAKFPGGFPVTLPKADTDGHEVRINSFSMRLIDGSIEAKGSVTLVDEILGSIDVDASFTAHIGLRWVDNPSGGQMLEPFLIEEPDIDVDLGFLGWLLTFLIGFLTFGLIGGLILVVVLAIVIEIAESIGAGKIFDSAGNLQGIAAWPVKLPNIGTISARFKNPVDIYSTGIRFIGEMSAISASFANIDTATANGPYTALASSALLFNGGTDKVFSQPTWLFGDGQSSVLRRPTHRYADSGLYVAKLRIAVNETGGVTTRNFTPVRLKNVQPKVSFDLSELSVEEGQEVEISANFTDPEWLDKHTAIFDWGDDSKPTLGTVHETNTEPEAKGTVVAKHAWCDNGNYLVRLRVTDDDGGIGEAILPVVVKNVQPVVTSVKNICVIVGQPVQMQATFEDNGWCDTHTAYWDFGDCQKKNAFVTETNEPPKAKGKVEVCHEWVHCGTYLTTVTVQDDDGAEGISTTIVHAVKLKNPMMEDGFRFPYPPASGRKDRVANGWHPYAEPTLSFDKDAARQPREWLFFPENFVELDGRRAQGLQFKGTMQAGMYQKICANVGWEYELSAAWHLVSPRQTGLVRIGIDPFGGINPNDNNIIWRELPPGDQEWQNVTIRAKAHRDEITLFIGGIDRFGGENTIYMDEAHLCQIQPTFCLPTKPPEEPCKETCVNFDDLRVGSQFATTSGEPPNLIYHNIDFFSVASLWISETAVPSPSHHLLNFTPRGIRVRLPKIVNEVKATIHSSGGGPVFKLETLLGNSVIAMDTLSLASNTEQEFTLTATALDGFTVRGDHMELALVKICFCMEKKPIEPNAHRSMHGDTTLF
jgi:PKD repeat protein